MRVILRRGNDQTITLVGLRTCETKIYLNAATVKATLFDSRGMPVPSFQDQLMMYVEGSNGDYQVLMTAAQAMLPLNVEYSLVFTAQETPYHYRVVHVASVVDGDTGCGTDSCQ